MPVFEQGSVRILFIHIPKTGGTSIENMLKKHTKMTFFSPIPPPNLKICPQHLQINDFRMLLNGCHWDWQFSIVRNPYDRIESEYHYTARMFYKNGGIANFSEWIINTIKNAQKNKSILDNHLRPQSEFLDREVEIFKFECGLNLIMSKLNKYISLPIIPHTPHDNKSMRSKVSWSLEALSLVNEFYANDFTQLNYAMIEDTDSFNFSE